MKLHELSGLILPSDVKIWTSQLEDGLLYVGPLNPPWSSLCDALPLYLDYDVYSIFPDSVWDDEFGSYVGVVSINIEPPV